MAGVVAVVMIFGVLFAGTGLAGAQVTADDGFNLKTNNTVITLAVRPDGSDTILLARGDDFPDSLEAFLAERGITRAVILGGTGTVSVGIEQRLLAFLE